MAFCVDVAPLTIFLLTVANLMIASGEKQTGDVKLGVTIGEVWPLPDKASGHDGNVKSNQQPYSLINRRYQTPSQKKKQTPMKRTPKKTTRSRKQTIKPTRRSRMESDRREVRKFTRIQRKWTWENNRRNNDVPMKVGLSKCLRKRCRSDRDCRQAPCKGSCNKITHMCMFYKGRAGSGKGCNDNRDCKSGLCKSDGNTLLGGRYKRGTCRQYLKKRVREGLVKEAALMSRQRHTKEPYGQTGCEYPKFGAYPQCTTSDECQRKWGYRSIQFGTDEYSMLCRYNCCVMRKNEML